MRVLASPFPRVLTILLVCVPLLAGCFADDAPGAASDVPQDSGESLVQQLARNLPAKALQPWDAAAGVDWWEDFAQGYPKRDALLPNNDLAAQHIAAGLTDAGLEATIVHYLPAPAPGAPMLPAGIHVVVGHKAGLGDPGHALALGAHYDTQAATIEGAFDNAAGTAMVFELCKTLAQEPMQRSLLCLFFDGEEEGALGSEAYLANPPEGSPDIDFYFGYDMVGINWPGYPTWKLYNWVQAEYATDLYPFVNATIHDVLGWPEDGAEAFDFNDRNSDEYNFIQANVPSVRFAGGRKAGDYDQYHKADDTVLHVYDLVGGRANFELGFGAIAQESYALALMLDQTNLLELQAAAA